MADETLSPLMQRFSGLLEEEPVEDEVVEEEPGPASDPEPEAAPIDLSPLMQRFTGMAKEDEPEVVTPFAPKVEDEAAPPERPANVWAKRAEPVWVEDWGDWGWTYKAPADAPNAGTEYTWDSAGNVVGNPERIREARSVQERQTRGMENRPYWWDLEEEETAIEYVSGIASNRNVPLAADADLLDNVTEVYKSFITSEEDLASFNEKLRATSVSGEAPEFTEGENRTREELLQASAFLDRIFPNDNTRRARERYEGRRSLRLPQDLTRFVFETSKDEDRTNRIQEYNREQEDRNLSQREQNDLINELHYGITDQPTFGQRVARRAIGSAREQRGVSQVETIPIETNAANAARRVTDEYVREYDQHIKNQASSNRVELLKPESEESSPYFVDIGNEARGILRQFTDAWRQDRQQLARSGNWDQAGQSIVSRDIVDTMSDEQKVHFDRNFAPMISDIASVAIVREIAERGQVATPALMSSYAERYTQNTDELSLLVAKHIPVQEQIKIASYSAPSAYQATQDLEAEAEDPTGETFSHFDALAILTQDPDMLTERGLPEQFAAATYEERSRWQALRRDASPSGFHPDGAAGMSDAELLEQWSGTPEGDASLRRLESLYQNYRRLNEYEQNEEVAGSGSQQAAEATRSRHNREMDIYRAEARKFLKQTNQAVSKHKVEAIAWGMMSQTIPSSIQTMVAVENELKEQPGAITEDLRTLGSQPQSDFEPDLESQQSKSLASPMPGTSARSTAAARANALADLSTLGSMFTDAGAAPSLPAPFKENANQVAEDAFNEEYGDVLPFPVRHQYTQESILNAKGVEGFYLRKALEDLHSSGVALDPAIVYSRAVFHFNTDSDQQNFQVRSRRHTEAMGQVTRSERRARLRQITDEVPISWITTASGQTAVETPDLHRRILAKVRDENPYQEWKESADIEGMTNQEAHDVYMEEMRFETSSLLADKILASQGTVFYMPFSDKTVAEMAKDTIPDWASPLRIFYASLVPVINTNASFDPGWAEGGRELTYGDLKQDNWMWQVFNVLPTNYLAVGARYGDTPGEMLGAMLNPSDEALEDVAGGLNTFTAFGDIRDDFSNLYEAVGLPTGLAEELSFYTSLGSTGYFAFKEPDVIIGAMAGVRSFSNVGKAGKNAMVSAGRVADGMDEFARVSSEASKLDEKQAALGVLNDLLYEESAGALQQWRLEAGSGLADIWGDSLTGLEGVVGLADDSDILQQIRSVTSQRIEAQRLRDSYLRQSLEETDEILAAQLVNKAEDAQALAEFQLYEEALIDKKILEVREQQLKSLLGDEDLTAQILSNEGIRLGSGHYQGERGVRELANDLRQLQRSNEIAQLQVAAALGSVVPRSSTWSTRPKKAHYVYTPESAVRRDLVGQVSYPPRIIRQTAFDRPPLVAARPPVAPALLPTHDSLSGVRLRLRARARAQSGQYTQLQQLRNKYASLTEETAIRQVELDNLIASTVDTGRRADFRLRAQNLVDEHQQKIARLMEDADGSVESAQAVIGEYRGFQVEYRKLIEFFAEESSETREMLKRLADERQVLQRLQNEVVESLKEATRASENWQKKILNAAKQEDMAWYNELLKQKKLLDGERKTLNRAEMLYGELAERRKIARRVDAYRTKVENRRGSVNVFPTDITKKLLNDIENWNNLEFLPIAYKKLEEVAKNQAIQIRKSKELLEANFAEHVARSAGRLSSQLEELTVEISNQELLDHVKEIRKQFFDLVPGEDAEALWEVAVMLNARQFARNTGRPMEEWFELNIKGFVDYDDLSPGDASRIEDARGWDLAEGQPPGRSGSPSRSARILFQAVEQGDAPIFYSQLADVILPGLFDGRRAIPVGELRRRLYKVNPDQSITPKAVKVGGKKESASVDEFMWTGFRNYLDETEELHGPRFQLEYEEVREIMDAHAIKLKFTTGTRGEYDHAAYYRSPGGNRRDGRTLHINWANRSNRGAPYKPNFPDPASMSHFPGELGQDHIGWARTSVRDVIVDGETKTVLMIDEIQSDWFQQAQKVGLTPPDMRAFLPMFKVMEQTLNSTIPLADRIQILENFIDRYGSQQVRKSLEPLLDHLRTMSGKPETVSGSLAESRKLYRDKLLSLVERSDFAESVPDISINIKVYDGYNPQPVVTKIGDVVLDLKIKPPSFRQSGDEYARFVSWLSETTSRLRFGGWLVENELHRGVDWSLQDLHELGLKLLKQNKEAGKVTAAKIAEAAQLPRTDSHFVLEKLLDDRAVPDAYIAMLFEIVHEASKSYKKLNPDLVRGMESSTERMLDTFFDVSASEMRLRSYSFKGKTPAGSPNVDIAGAAAFERAESELRPFYDMVVGDRPDAFWNAVKTGDSSDKIAELIVSGVGQLKNSIRTTKATAGPLSKVWRDVIFKRAMRLALDEGYDGVAFQPTYAISRASYGPWHAVNRHYSIIQNNAKKYTTKTWGRDADDPIVWTHARFPRLSSPANDFGNDVNLAGSRPSRTTTPRDIAVPEDAWFAKEIGPKWTESGSYDITEEIKEQYVDYVFENVFRTIDPSWQVYFGNAKNFRSEMKRAQDHVIGDILSGSYDFVSTEISEFRRLAHGENLPESAVIGENALIGNAAYDLTGHNGIAHQLLATSNTIPIMLFNNKLRNSNITQRLFQKDGLGAIKGATEFLDDGRAVLIATKSADVSTIVHEMGHIIRRSLSRDQRLALRRWIAQDLNIPFEKTVVEGTSEWTVQAEEAFARGFERMFAIKGGQTFDVTSMDAATAEAFRKVRTHVAKVYDTVGKRKQLGKPLTPEAREVMDQIVGAKQRIPIAEIYGPGKRISRKLFQEKISEVLKDSLGADAPHANSEMFLKNLQDILGGTEADILRRLTNFAAGDLVVDGQELQALYNLLDEIPDFIMRYHFEKEGISGGMNMLGVLGSKHLQDLRAGRASYVVKATRKWQQIFDPDGSRFGQMKEEVAELVKAHANMQRQATDELNLILRQNRTPDTYKQALINYVDGQIPIKTPNGYTVFNQGPLTLFRHLQKYVEDHPYYGPERRASVQAEIAKRQKELAKEGKTLSAAEKLDIMENFNKSDDLAGKTEALRALARVFVQNTERYPISGAQALDLEEVAYKLLTGKHNTPITFQSLKTYDGKAVTHSMGVRPVETSNGTKVFIKPVNSMAEFIEEMKKAHKVVLNYKHKFRGSVYKQLHGTTDDALADALAGELPAVSSIHEALSHATQIASHAKIQNESINDFRKIFGVLTEEEAMKMNRMIEDPTAAIDTLDLIGARYLGLQRVSRAKRTKMLGHHNNLVELSRKMVSVSKTPEGQMVFMPYDLAKKFDETMTALVKDIDAITPEGAQRTSSTVKKFAMGYLSWWRQSVLTGILMPNPRYWVNNIVGDMSQMITSIGVGPAAKLSFQNLWSNIEIGKFKPHTWLLDAAAKTEGKPVLGSMMNALFNPRLNNVWSGKNGFMTLPDGRQLPYGTLRNWLVKDGILDSFTQAELATEMRKVMEKQKWYTTSVDWFRNKQFDLQSHATMVQQRQRTALYLDLLEKGYSRTESRRMTLEALYDWRNALSQAEMNSVTLLFMPFWRFHKLAMKQMGVSFFEAYTMPGKQYWKKLATGRTKWTRLRGQAQIANNIPHIVSPAEEEDWTEHEGRLNLMARLFTPPWAGHLHSWDVPGRLNQAEWDWMKQNIGHEQSFNRAGYRIWYGPQLTATHQLQIFNSFFSLFTAGTATFAAKIQRKPAGHYLTDGWERQAIEPWTGMMHRPIQQFATTTLQNLGFDPGFVPGRFRPSSAKLTNGEKRVFDALDAMLGGWGPFGVETRDAQGRWNANPVAAALWKETPFFGLQLMGVLDKSARARGYASAKFPDNEWKEFWYGWAYFTGAWSGLTKPYEFVLDKNYDKFIEDLQTYVGLEELPQKQKAEDFNTRYFPHR